MENPPQEPSPENIDAEIEKLLDVLNGYGELFDKLSKEKQEEWYWTEMEGKVGKDRKVAKEQLKEFISFLEKKKRE